MTFTRFSNADGGVSGTAPTGSDASSGFIFNTIIGTIAKYDNTQSVSGSQSFKFTSAGAAGYLVWSIAQTAPTYYARFYFRYTGAPTATPIGYFANSGSQTCGVSLTVAGKITAQVTGTHVTTSTTTLSADTWYRIELSYTTGASATVSVRLYDMTSALLETITTAPASSTGISFFRFGVVQSGVTLTCWIDDPAVWDQGWIGTLTSLPTIRANNFSGMSNGATPSIATSGGVSGDNSDSQGGFVSWTYPRPGGSVLGLNTSGSSGAFIWNVSGGTADIYLRSYVFWTVNLSSATKTAVMQASAGGSAELISAGTASSKIYAGLSTGVVVAGTYVMSQFTWYRMETRIHCDPSAGYAEVFLYDMAGNQLDHVTSAASYNTAKPGSVGFGFGAFPYLDSVALSDQGWIGAAADIPTMMSRKGSAFIDVFG